MFNRKYLNQTPFCLLLLCAMFITSPSVAQVRWDGGGGDQDWNNALNWSNDQVPDATSDVQLDNSIVDTSYTLPLPAGNAVVVNSFKIFPSLSNIIRVEITSENQNSPALTVTGMNYSLEIGANGHFINSSGASSGASIVLADSLAIYNGGRYVHRTARAHAAMVTKLSAAPGTEEGIFEFDVPSASSTISLSDRRYGMLVLSSIAANGLVNYTAAGTRPILVRSNLQVNPGVRLNLNCSDTFFVCGDLLQYGGVVNLGTLTRSLVFAIGGNLAQAKDASIIESGTANPLLLFNGDMKQSVDMKGGFLNDISFQVLNVGGLELMTAFTIPYKLQLVKGIIKTTDSSLLTLGPLCLLEADSLSSVSFIDGPLRREGMVENMQYLFPVGKVNRLRWVSMKNASGICTIEFIRSNPRIISNQVQGISHVSALDYWTLTTDDPGEDTQIELSFFDGNSSGVTDMSMLRVARLVDGTWVNGGNSSTSGSAGGDGSVVSDALSGFTPSIPVLFALSSSSAAQNPLPLNFHSLAASALSQKLQFRWQMENVSARGYFVIQENQNGHWKNMDRAVPMHLGTRFYKAEIPNLSIDNRYFRILAVSQNDTVYSRVIRVFSGSRQALNLDELICRSSLQSLELKVSSGSATNAWCIVMDASGRILRKAAFQLQKGSNSVVMNLGFVPKGILFVRVVSMNNQSKTIKFLSR